MSKQPISDELKQIPATLYDVTIYAASAADDTNSLHEQVNDSVSRIHQDVATMRMSIAALTSQVALLVQELKNDRETIDTKIDNASKNRDLACHAHGNTLGLIRQDIDESYEDRKEIGKDVNSLKTNFKSLVVGVIVLQFCLQLALQFYFHHTDADAKTAQNKVQTEAIK